MHCDALPTREGLAISTPERDVDSTFCFDNSRKLCRKQLCFDKSAMTHTLIASA
jgi:hypothetical protein